jgi:hypothetical protein
LHIITDAALDQLLFCECQIIALFWLRDSGQLFNAAQALLF